ncbi:putative exonuclease [Cellulomonas flavigena DSM 20109]|uniref:Nuclease SbcCD subunit C n=1 Tax=Cellulomonas flavigena (strain ATCC 482 / DSM 20109 / BCRC 11376 / JCM 18109 / NBRC 3775 / NCIMB 8073 / NRS 134) TaxID=446466 RepID=D5UFT5_CELFN|nr:SMC family ATPase [Cellulomonas flavigena]ADG73044.1 putative exonuclease [Cellulomonas flavigena DSM 20109]
MRLRSLTVQAIGPFAGRHTVDLDALGQSGLFLLEGPTGSGKSTLIDAVVFALYGKVAGTDASDERLRSAYAADDVESVVDLVFEVPSGVYRVRRTPAYRRAKRRGEGTTTAQASVKAWRLPADVELGEDPEELDGVGVLLGTRLDEVGHELQRIVGLDRTQFVQTVVLPQGEFARFLRATGEERRVLLQKIFGTQVYEQLQQRLAALRAEAARTVEAARAGLGEAVAHLLGACALGPEEHAAARVALDEAVAGGPGVAVRVAGVVVATTRALDAAAGTLAQEAASARTSWDAARAAHEAARATAALAARRDALRAERRALDAAAGQHEDDVQRLARARAAAAVRPLLTGWQDARTAHEAGTKSLVAACDTAPADLLPPGGAAVLVVGGRDGGPGPDAGGTERLDGVLDAWRPHLRAERDAAADAAAALRRTVEVEAGLTERRRAVRELAAVLEELRSEVDAATTWLAGRPGSRAALEQERDAARALAGRSDAAEQARTAARALVADVAALTAARADLAAAQDAVAGGADAARAAVAAEASLRAARVAGLAGELAAGLVAGDPCPVCGACEHPAPASVGADHVTAEQVRAAEEARAAAESQLAALGARRAALAERVAGLAARVGEHDAGAAAALLRAAEDDVAAAAAAHARVATLEADLTAHDAATRDRAQVREEVLGQVRAAELTLETERDALGRAEAEVADARADHPTVAARHAALDARARQAVALLDALDTERAAAADEQRRHAELDAALAEHGFADVADARGAWCPATELADLERRVVARTADEARVDAGLADPALVALPEDVAPDLAGTEGAERAARRSADDLEGRARVAAARAEAAADAAARVRAAAEALDAAAAAAAPVTRMANLASGTGADNPHALSLATYVLGRRFEDVVAAANERLAVMSDGRFELVRSDEKEDVRTRAVGLAMRVVDHRTERARDPRTLSGGETFYVSLCLALGMADVVTAEAGGVELGTLFVDEGFGALDPHVLDQVLAELGRLRHGGRVVGIVSHVETLKQAVADRIEVRPTPAGPSTLTVLAG